MTELQLVEKTELPLVNKLELVMEPQSVFPMENLLALKKVHLTDIWLESLLVQKMETMLVDP